MSSDDYEEDVYDIELYDPVPYRNGDPVEHLHAAYLSGGTAEGINVIIPNGRDQSCTNGDLWIGRRNIVWMRVRRQKWSDIKKAHGGALG